MEILTHNPSLLPPGGLEVKNVPQFVSLGFDDNESPKELEWIRQFVLNKKNRDGSPVRFSFYNNGILTNSLPQWKKLLEEGHELGDHSFSHPHGQKTDWSVHPPTFSVLMDEEQWLKEINRNREAFKEAGVDPGVLKGFRTPFLEFTNETFKAIAAAGYGYDCSVEEGYQDDMNPGNYFWPYTLHAGSPGDTSFSRFVPGRKPLGNYPGLWEMPVYVLHFPPDSLAKEYSFPKGLRKKAFKYKPYIKERNWKLTGFDWNYWYTDDGKPFLTGEEVLAILKYNLDLHIQGNRAPFVFGAHSQFYDTPERRKTLEEFILYALSKEEVIMNPVSGILDWIKDPVPLSSMVEKKQAV